MSQLSAPLPQEAVGVGGKWTVTHTLSQGGIEIESTSTMTLMNVSADSFDVETHVMQSAEPQDVKVPGTATTMRVVSYKTVGTGGATILLDRLSPRKLDMNLTTDSAMEMQMGDTPQELTQHMEVKMNIEQGAPATTKPAEQKPDIRKPSPPNR
jgi:hypothetical protein